MGAPLGPRGSALIPGALATAVTWGARAISRTMAGLYPCPLPMPGLAIAVATTIWDGLVVSNRSE